MAGRAEKIEQILKNLQTETPDVEGAVLLSMDGLPMASVLSADITEDDVAAIAAALLGMGEKAVENLNKGALNRVLVQGEDGYILLVGAGEEVVLAVITTKKAKIGMIFFDANHAAKEIAKIL